VIRPSWAHFPLDDLLGSLMVQFAEQVQSKGLGWRIVPSRLAVRSDRHLLAEIVRNLLSNALRYTDRGKVLLGCRRRGDRVRIEIWDTGIGISQEELPRIFEPYYRTGKAGRRNGLGLGLAIVQRLGELLAHPIGVRSRLGKGSVFSIEVPIAAATSLRAPAPTAREDAGGPRTGTILVIEDDAVVQDMLQVMLTGQGHRVTVASSGDAALKLVAGNGLRPDLVISDYNLPGELDGTQTAAALRAGLGCEVPVIILSGDVRADKRRQIMETDCVSVAKPVKARELAQLIQRLLAGPSPAAAKSAGAPPPGQAAATAATTIFIVDDDRDTREAMRMLLTGAGYQVKSYPSAQAFLQSLRPGDRGCVVTDVRMPGMNGLEMLARLEALDKGLPAVLITGQGDIGMAVQAMRAGAVDFIEKPASSESLLAAIDRALRQSTSPAERSAARGAAAMRLAGLTRREREVMDLVVAGHANKEVAIRLGINQRTVEAHRAAVMRKVGVRSLADLIRLDLAARGGRQGLST